MSIMDKSSSDMPAAAIAADFDVRLQTAGSLHRAGQLAEAESHYRVLLTQQPQHATLLHLAGLCALQQGQPELALARLALALAPGSADPALHSNHGLALQGAGRYDAALDAYHQALALDPTHPDALFNLGGLLMQLQQPGPALEIHERLLAIHPHHPPTLLRRAAALRALGRAHDALEACRQVHAWAPDDRAVWLEMALAARDAQQFDTALELLARFLAVEPEHPYALWQQGLMLRATEQFERALASYDQASAVLARQSRADIGMQVALSAGRATVLRDLGRPEQALAGYDEALALMPDFADAWSNRGAVLADLARFGEALHSYARALALQPDHPQAALNRANALREMGQGRAALRAYDTLLLQRYDEAAIWFDRGLALMTLARYHDARDSYAKALELAPHDADLRWSAALCALLLGDYTAGWRGYEARWDSRRLRVPRRPFPQALWLGDTELQGRRVLVHAEQGLGDTLQFCRYVPLLAERGATVILEVQPALRRLLSTLPGVTQLIAQGEALPPFDLHCPIPSLPLACLAAAPVPPARVPYLRADPNLREHWQTRLRALEGKGKGDRAPPRIGIVWHGSGSQARYARHLPQTELASLLTLPAHFISLQVDTQAGEADLPQLTHFKHELHDFADTAALVEHLDLVISVDTAVAHLAGALACPLWVLLPFNADWRWMSGRSDSPWYPSARIFRQAAPGQWAGVIDAVRAALRAELARN